MTETTQGSINPEQLQAIQTSVREALDSIEVILENHKVLNHLDQTTLNMARRSRRKLEKALQEF